MVKLNLELSAFTIIILLLDSPCLMCHHSPVLLWPLGPWGKKQTPLKGAAGVWGASTSQAPQGSGSAVVVPWVAG